jgi:hypothetical protein
MSIAIHSICGGLILISVNIGSIVDHHVLASCTVVLLVLRFSHPEMNYASKTQEKAIWNICIGTTKG